MAVGDVAADVRVGIGRAGAPQRAAGAGGLIFLTLVAFQNVIRAATGPATNASPSQVLAFFESHTWTVDALAVTYILGFVPLFAFSAGVAERAHADSGARLWARIGSASVGVIAVLFGLVNALQVVLVAANQQLHADPAVVQALWSAHNALFTLNFVAVAGALAGLGVAAAASGLTPAWMRTVAIGGAVLLAGAALPIVAEVHGSPVLGIGVLGFLAWLLLLGMAGTRMLRGRA
jgi:hypothetical protein